MTSDPNSYCEKECVLKVPHAECVPKSEHIQQCCVCGKELWGMIVIVEHQYFCEDHHKIKIINPWSIERPQ